MRQLTRTLITFILSIVILTVTVGFAFPSHVDSVVVNGLTYSRTVNEFHPLFLLCFLALVPLFIWYMRTYTIDGCFDGYSQI
jgi:hypothetical protein